MTRQGKSQDEPKDISNLAPQKTIQYWREGSPQVTTYKILKKILISNPAIKTGRVLGISIL